MSECFYLVKMFFYKGQNSVTANKVIGLKLHKMNKQILAHKSGPGGSQQS